MNISQKMKTDWDRRAKVDARYWVEVSNWEDDVAFRSSAVSDTSSLLEGLDAYLSKDAFVLDIGCGIGRMMEILSDKYENVYGSDVSGEMIEVGKERLAHKKNVHFYENNGVDLSIFEDNKFDFVFSYAALPHMPKNVMSNYFRETGRVLKVDSVFKVQLWIGEPNDTSGEDTLTPRIVSEKELERLCKNNGFDLLSRKTLEYIDPILKISPVWCTFINNKNALNMVDVFNFKEEISSFGGLVPDTEAELFLFYGGKMFEKGNFYKAKEALVAALQLNSKLLDGYSLLAAIFIEEGDIKSAINCLEKALVEIPSYLEGRELLGRLYKSVSIREKTVMNLGQQSPVAVSFSEGF